MDKLNFDFQPFGEQLVMLYQQNHLEDTVNSEVAGIVDKAVADWNHVEAPTLDSVSELALYEVQRRADLDNKLRTDLGSIASEGFVNYATRQVDLAVQKTTVKLAFQDYLKEFTFDKQEQPTKQAIALMEGQEESEGFRKIVATTYHHFCRDFQLDEAFKYNTKQIVDTFQRSFMLNDFRHLLARYKDVGTYVLTEVGYKK